MLLLRVNQYTFDSLFILSKMLKKEIPVLISVRNCLFCDKIAGAQKMRKARTSGNPRF